MTDYDDDNDTKKESDADHVRPVGLHALIKYGLHHCAFVRPVQQATN